MSSRISPNFDSMQAAFAAVHSLDIEISSTEREISNLLDVLEDKIGRVKSKLEESIHHLDKKIELFERSYRELFSTQHQMNRKLEESIDRLFRSHQQMREREHQFEQRVVKLEGLFHIYYPAPMVSYYGFHG